MSIDLNAYLEVFAEEAREHLQALNQALLDFEKSYDQEVVNVMFRSAHTLKGMSATMGFSEVAELTHNMENLLSPIRQGELKATAPMVDLLFKCLDALQEMIEAHIASEGHSVDISELVRQLAAHMNGGAAAGPEIAVATLPRGRAYPGVPDSDALSAMAAAPGNGLHVYHVRVRLHDQCEMQGVRAFMVLRLLRETGELFHSEPSEQVLCESEFGGIFDLLFGSESEPEQITAQLRGVSDVQEVDVRLVLAEDPLAEGPADPQSAASLEIFKLNDYVVALANAAISEGARLDHVHVHLAVDCSLKSARAFMVYKQLEALGDIIASQPETEAIEQENFDLDLHFLLLSRSEPGAAKAALQGISEVDSIDVYEGLQPQAARPEAAAAPAASAGPALQVVPAPGADTPLPAAAAQAGAGPGAAERSEGGRPQVKQTQTIRVDTERLDVLLNLVGELVIGKTRLASLASSTKSGELSGAIEHFGHIVSDLQNIVMQTRMVPIETVFNRFPRMIRDLAKARGKQIDLVMTGGETELDRTVIDEIGDPLVHLIRNGLDHGVETPEERLASGKSAVGTLTLAAFHEGSNVFIQIRDDGRGIDAERIRQKAVEKCVITAEQAAGMSREQAINLIFAAGFSTAEQITDISGRGVGMDVVRTKIEQLSGEIKVQTEVGQGSIFTIKLPLTLAIVQALLIRVAGEDFAIPLAYIEETLKVDPAKIQKVKDQDVYLLRGEILPLVHMHDLLLSPERLEGRGWRVVVVRSGSARAGLMVDETVGQTEIVIKSLGRHLQNTPYISGGTILGDGTVALILDVPQIAA
ncbi:chemotaxis protein CheW [bacterium]|nr:chemotaxis protein CheW [bacterium]